MPREYHETVKEQDQPTRTQLGKPNSRVNMPMCRFRLQAGRQSWVIRVGSKKIKAGLLALFQEHHFDPVRSGNSTEPFGRDLETFEIQQVQLGNIGKFGVRAGERALDSTARAKKLEDTKRRIKQRANTGTNHSGSSQATVGNGGMPRSEQVGDGHNINPSVGPSVSRAPNQPQRKYPRGVAQSHSQSFTGPEQSVEELWRKQQEFLKKRKREAPSSNDRDKGLGEDAVSKKRRFEDPTQNGGSSTAPIVIKSEEDDSASDEPISRKRKRHNLKTEDSDEEDIDGKSPVSKRRYQPSNGDRMTESRDRRQEQALPSTANLAQPRRPSSRYRFVGPKAPAESVDYRHVISRDDSERKILDEALAASREAYFEWVGHPAPTCNRTQSYMSRYEQLCRSMDFDWGMQPQNWGLQLPIPHLPVLPPWNTSLSNWGPHVQDADFFEAWRFGHRCPRLADGSVIGIPGDLLRKLSKMEAERKSAMKGVMLAFGFVPNGEYLEEDPGLP